MNFQDDDLFRSAEVAEKPSKENSTNAPYCFPNYLGNTNWKIKLGFVERPPIVDFINSTPSPSTIFKIEPDRVVEDGRTTCMIKNIPNKFSSNMLIDFVNQTHFGQFDFLYLRMDFKNKCNVGYAFINFIETKCIQSFYDRINGKRWINFTSSKIAELTYASIQGFDNLMKKFKNSSIMYEEKSFRPRIFHKEGMKRGLEKGVFE